MNALPPGTEIRDVRVRGILRIYALTDGPYLLQDLDAFERERGLKRVVTVAYADNIEWLTERYELALVVITGNYRRSVCRGPGYACPHIKNELQPQAIEVLGYPDKSTVEARVDLGREVLKALTPTDPMWGEVSDIARRLVIATRDRDVAALRVLIDVGDRAAGTTEWEPGWIEADLRPGGRVYWRLFDPESAFVTERKPSPDFRAYRINADMFSSEEQAFAICFDRNIRSAGDWPNSVFDLETENLGDPFACVEAFKDARGWWLSI